MPLFLNFPEWIKPEIISGLPIRWYGLMYLVAFAIAYIMFMVQVKERKLDVNKDQVINMFFFAILGLLLGARLLAATVYDPSGRYLREPWKIFWPFEDGQYVGLQGMSFHGGLIGAVVAILIYCRVKKIDVLDWGDMLVQGIPLGYTFGRIGNFINGELYGKVAQVPWGMYFPNARRIPANADWLPEYLENTGLGIPDGQLLLNLPRHPSQLYEAFFEGIVLWLILWFVVRPRRPFKGFSIGLYMIGYGLARFVIEYLREPDAELGYILRLGGVDGPTQIFTSLGLISMGQILCLLMMIAGGILLVVFHRLHLKRPAFERIEAPAPEKAAKPAKAQERRPKKKGKEK